MAAGTAASSAHVRRLSVPRATRSPGLKPVTPGPTASTAPAPPSPGTQGSATGVWYVPERIIRSAWFTATAWTRTSSSPAAGDGAGISLSLSCSGPPMDSMTMALM